MDNLVFPVQLRRVDDEWWAATPSIDPQVSATGLSAHGAAGLFEFGPHLAEVLRSIQSKVEAAVPPSEHRAGIRLIVRLVCVTMQKGRAVGTTLTADELLALIQFGHDQERLALSGCDLSGINLSQSVVAAKYERLSPVERREVRWYSTFTRGVDLRRTVLDNSICSGATLAGADLRGASLKHAVLSEANLEGAHFDGADLTGARLDSARLNGASFGLGARDTRRDVDPPAHVQRTREPPGETTPRPTQPTILRGAVFDDAHAARAYFGGVQGEGTSFLRTRLDGAIFANANLCGAVLRGQDLSRVTLSEACLDAVDLRNAHAEGCDLRDLCSISGARWAGVRLDRTLLPEGKLGRRLGDEVLDSLGTPASTPAMGRLFRRPSHTARQGSRARRQTMAAGYRNAARAYRALRVNFAGLGQFEEVSWAYVREQRMTRKALLYEGRMMLWLRNWIFELTTGYGDSFKRPLFTVLGTIAAFMFLYMQFASITTTQSTQANLHAWEKGFDSKCARIEAFLDARFHVRAAGDSLRVNWNGMCSAFVFSAAAFFTMGFNSMEPASNFGRLLASLEAALGIAFFGLLLFAVTRQVNRA